MALVINGLKEMRRALRDLEPDLLKESDRAIRPVLARIASDARSLVPTSSGMRNWDNQSEGSLWGARRFNATEVKRGIVPKIGVSKPTRSGYSSAYAIANKSAAGSIYEMAGRHKGTGGKSRNPRAGQQFIARLNARGGALANNKKSGRLAFKAVERDQGKAQDAIVRAIRITEAKFIARTKGRV